MATNKPFQVSRSSSQLTLTNGLLAVGAGNILLEGGQSISDATGGYISNIEITEIDGIIYKYQVIATGKGPGVECHFTDQTDDTYALSLDSPIVENHTVDYNSSGPNYVKIVINLPS